MGNKSKKWRVVNYFLLLFLLIFFANPSGEMGISTTMMKILEYVLIGVSCMIIVAITHELGHLIIGTVLRYKFISFSVAFINIYIENQKIKVQLRMPKTFWGYCVMQPNPKLYYGYISYLSGGIILNIVTGILFVFMAIRFESSRTFLITLAALSFFIAITNSIPAKKINSSNDGWNIRNVLSHKDTFDKYIKAINNTDVRTTITRPREFEVELDKNEKFDLHYHLQFYYKALDSDDIDTIKYCGNLFEENFDMANDATFLRFCYVVIHSACVTGDTETAKKYYDKCKKRIVNDNDCNGLRVRAYYEYYINNNYDYSYELCSEGISVADKFVSEIQGVMEKDLMFKLQNQIKSESMQTT